MVDSDNQRGIVGQQLSSLRRFWGAITCRAGWIPGDVAFDERYRPMSTRHLDLHEMSGLHRETPAIAATVSQEAPEARLSSTGAPSMWQASP
jgi:hypothetical protein